MHSCGFGSLCGAGPAGLQVAKSLLQVSGPFSIRSCSPSLQQYPPHTHFHILKCYPQFLKYRIEAMRARVKIIDCVSCTWHIVDVQEKFVEWIKLSYTQPYMTPQLYLNLLKLKLHSLRCIQVTPLLLTSVTDRDFSSLFIPRSKYHSGIQ